MKVNKCFESISGVWVDGGGEVSGLGISGSGERELVASVESLKEFDLQN
jgi:hypothetical protein